MVIQCTSCQTKYRLNLERIPNRKTFVKCRGCGTPIYIDPPAEEPQPFAVSGVPSAATPAAMRDATSPTMAAGAALDAESPIIACPNCATRYRLPAAAMSRPNAKMKCTRCGNVFTAGGGGAEARTHRVPPAASDGRDFFPGAGEEADRMDGSLERPMPIPDDSELDGMFDDFRERATPFAAGSARAGGVPKAPPPDDVPAPDFSGMDDDFGDEGDRDIAKIRGEMGVDLSGDLGFQGGAQDDAARDGDMPSGTLFSTDLEQLGDQASQAASKSLHPAREADPERAYLEAVAVDQELPRPTARGTVPDEQKYRFFLKPGVEPPPIKAPQGARPAGAAPARAPGAEAGMPALRRPGPPPPLEPVPDEAEEMAAAFEPAAPAAEEEIYPPPIHEPSSAFEAELDAVDLDVMAGELEEDAELTEGLDVSDDVDLLLQQHGVAADAMDDEDMPSIVHADPLAPVGESVPALPMVGRPLGRPLAMTARRGFDRGLWLNRAATAGLIAAALAVVAAAFYIGYRLG